jgi:hypothetical protein
MSINHFTDPELDINVKSLKINNITLSQPVTGRYDALITSNNPGLSTTNGFVYYNIIGDQMHISLSRIVVVGTTSHSIEFNLPLPPGYNYPVALTGVQGQGYLHSNTTLLLTGSAMDNTAIGVTFVVTNDSALPAISGSAFLNCSFVVRV